MSVEKVVTEFSEGKKLIHFNVKFSVWKSIIVWFSLLLLLLMIMVSKPG